MRFLNEFFFKLKNNFEKKFIYIFINYFIIFGYFYYN